MRLHLVECSQRRIACCLAVGLGLGPGLDSVSGWLIVTHSAHVYVLRSVVIVTPPRPNH